MAGLDPAMRFPSLGDNPLGKVRGFMGAPSPSKESDFGGTTQCLGWLTESPNKGATHAVRITKAGTSGYRLDRFSSALDLFAGRFEPQPLDILGGSRAGFGRNATDAEFVLTSARRRVRREGAVQCLPELRRVCAASDPAGRRAATGSLHWKTTGGGKRVHLKWSREEIAEFARRVRDIHSENR